MVLFKYEVTESEVADMAFADRLKEARLKKSYTQEQIAEKIGVAKSTYTGYEKGNREPNVNTIGKLMEELGVDANFLWQDDTTFPFELTYDEMENLVKKYRALDEHGKEMVDFTLTKEWERSTAEAKNNTIISLSAPVSNEDLNAAHGMSDASPEDQKHDNNIMDSEDF